MSNQTEFHMVTDVATVSPKELLFNYDELKAFLDENLEMYRNFVVTPDNLTDARAARARVNKVAKALNDQKIAVKKQIMKTYTEDFEPKCKELIAMAKEVADSIGRQIDEVKAVDAIQDAPVSIVFKATGTTKQLMALRDWAVKHDVKLGPYNEKKGD